MRHTKGVAFLQYEFKGAKLQRMATSLKERDRLIKNGWRILW